MGRALRRSRVPLLLALLPLTIAPPQAGAIGLPLPTIGAATVETTADTATITVLVMPLGLSASWSVEYGLTTSYGAATAPVSVPLAGGLAPMRTTIAGLAADGRYHYRSVLSGPWTVPVVTPDATFDTATAAIGIDDGDLGTITSLGTEYDGGVGDAPGTGTTAPPATPARGPAPTIAPATAVTPGTPAPTPKPTLVAAGPRATVTARSGAVAIALSGSPTAVTLKLPARAATRARLAITTAGRTRTARLQGSRTVRIGTARALVRAGRILVSRLPAKTTALRLTPSAGTTITARQVTATAS